MNRCIQCYRCVRFYHDYAGGTDLNVLGSHNHVYFGRSQEGTLESEFSGNLVEICPTGVFTDKSLKTHYTRKWDLQTAPTVCVHCGLGCNTITGERYDTLRRVRNRYHHQINGYFLCDRGRYGYEFVNSDRRIRRPLAKAEGGADLSAVTEEQALELAAAMLSGGGKVIGIGSPRASLEDNFALRTLVGADHFYAGMAGREVACLNTTLEILREGPVPASTLQGIGLAGAALVLGEDVTQTAPLVALNLRRLRYQKSAGIAAKFRLPGWNDAAVREIAQLQQADLFVASTHPTRLDREARLALRAAPDELAGLGYAVLSALDAERFPRPELNENLRQAADEIARTLLDVDNPLVVCGASSGSPELIEAAANIAWCLQRKGRKAGLALCVPECNSLGLAMMGAQGLDAAFEAVEAGGAETVVVLQNDLFRRADSERVNALLERAKQVLVIDHLETPTSKRADLVLPAATFAEAGGTWINNEGRAQRSHAVMAPGQGVRAGWRWLGALMNTAGRQQAAWNRLQDVVADLIEDLAVFQPVADLDTKVTVPTPSGKIPRQSHRYTGRTAMHANIEISEPKPPEDDDSPLAFSMEGYDGQPPSGLISRLWAPGWNSEQALNKFQSEIGGPLRGGDPGLRLIEPTEADSGRYFEMPPPSEGRKEGQFLLVPVHHIFGSEALSMAAPAIAGRAPRPYLALNPENAPAAEGEQVRLQMGARTLELAVKLVQGLPQGLAGLPSGIPGLPVVDGPLVVDIQAVKGKDRG
ncbi:MAG: molybdopterin-dependent oxidoreductase [Desulfosarcinaceae bacterium]